MEVHTFQRSGRSFWRQVRYWLQAYTFTPTLLARPLQHLVVGYLAAICLQCVLVLSLNSLALRVPTLHFLELPTLLVILLVAFAWGIGPGIVATLVATGLFMFVFLSPVFPYTLVRTENSFGLVFFVCFGLLLTLLACHIRYVRVARHRLYEIFMQAPTSLALLSGPEYHIVLANPLYMRQAGYADIVGKSVREVLPEAQPFVEQLDRVYKTGIPFTSKEVPVLLDLQDDGRLAERYFDFMYLPTRTSTGLIDGVVVHGIDVTEHVNSRQQMQGQEENERMYQLEATFEAMVDGVLVYDQDGNMIRINNAYRRLIAMDDTPAHAQLSPEQRGRMLALRDEQGELLKSEQMPVQRMLAGEVFTAERAMDIRVRALNGREVQLNITGTPLYDQQHQLTGGVLIFRDVTERRALERRTQEALEALLMMAEEVVRLPDQEKLHAEISNQLAELVRRVMGCQRVGLTTVDQRTGTFHSLAVVGLSSEQEQLWKERRPGFSLHELLQGILHDSMLHVNDILVFDFSQPPLLDRPNPYGIQTMALVPMKIGGRLIGLLALDNGGEAHSYTAGERALAKAVADLAALIIERERLQAERAEAQANEIAAREATRLMEEFIGIAGHELRTPLTTMKASVQLAKRQIERMLKQDMTFPPEVMNMTTSVKSFLDRAERQANMQNRLVSDLLDVSRVQAGRLELHPELHDIVTLIYQVVEDQRVLTPERTIHFETPLQDDVLVMVDADRLRQVVNNYLSNALKYSEANKPVDVRVELVAENKVQVSVRDQGPGLSEAQQQRIWDRFYRVPGIDVRSGSGVGLGLGLHISKTMVERQGGNVGVQSVPGQGSLFWLTLPLPEVQS